MTDRASRWLPALVVVAGLLGMWLGATIFRALT